MTNFDYDLFVIGAGSGGVRAARMAAAAGVKVAIAENRHLGGTCVNVGCVPKKLLVYASQFSSDFQTAKGFGWDIAPPVFDWNNLLANKNSEIQRLQNVYADLLQGSGVTVMHGQAQITGAQTVKFGDQSYRCQRILIATGSRSSVPDIPGKEFVATSDAMFALQSLPQRLLIVGGGYIAVEFAGIMQGLGVETTLCYRGEKLLRGFDDDLRDFATQEMRKKGLDIHLNSQIIQIEKTAQGYTALTDKNERFEADLILYATGRHANIEGLGIDALGIALHSNGSIKIDQHYQTNIESIYALGDVANRFNLTPVATAEAMAFVSQCYSDTPKTVDYENIPTAVFSQPNIATVGLSESEARKRFQQIAVYQSVFTSMKYAFSGSDEKTLLKLVVNQENDRVVGAHMVGNDAGEIIQGMAIAIRAGATKAVFDSTIGIHPTIAEEFVTMRTPIRS